jgi:hypothetical protein
MAQNGHDTELYAAGGDKYAGYATTIPMDEEEDEEEPRPGIGGPRCGKSQQQKPAAAAAPVAMLLAWSPGACQQLAWSSHA